MFLLVYKVYKRFSKSIILKNTIDVKIVNLDARQKICNSNFLPFGF